jgi:predicted metal-binding membrane protein
MAFPYRHGRYGKYVGGNGDCDAMACLGATGFALMFLMWAVLMVGMTLTSAAPMILLFATINRKRVTGSAQHAPTRCFRAGLSSRLDRI